jgi:hypothetical protein
MISSNPEMPPGNTKIISLQCQSNQVGLRIVEHDRL